MKKSNIGWILLVAYYVCSIANAIINGSLGWFFGFLFTPFISIPIHIILNLIFDFWATIIDVAWVGLGIYLLYKGEN